VELTKHISNPLELIVWEEILSKKGGIIR
jgi:hypothetical protein